MSSSLIIGIIGAIALIIFLCFILEDIYKGGEPIMEDVQ